MKWIVAAVAMGVLLGGPTGAQVATPSAGPELGGLRAAVQSYVDELNAALPAVQQQLQGEDAAARQFAQYLRRMHADAALQRTVLALGNLRAPVLAQAQRNWHAWEDVARDRLAQAASVAAAAKEARQDETERWELLGDESTADLAASLGAAYRTAEALHGRKLALLSRLDALAGRSAKEAQAGVDLCMEVEKAVSRTADRVRRRFLWTRVPLADLTAGWDEARSDLGWLLAPLAEVSPAEARTRVLQAARANWISLLTAVLVLAAAVWRGRALRRYLQHRLAGATTDGTMSGRLAAGTLAAARRCLVSGAVAALALGLRLGLNTGLPLWSQPVLSVAIAVFVWRFAYVLVGELFDPHRRIVALGDVIAGELARRLQRLAIWLLLATIAAALVRRAGLTATPFMLAFVAVDLLAIWAARRLLQDERLAAAGAPRLLARWLRRWRLTLDAGVAVMLGLCGFGFLNFAWYLGWSLLMSTALGAVVLLGWRAGEEVLARAAVRLTPGVRRGLRQVWGGAAIAGGLLALPVVWNVEGAVFAAAQALLDFGIPLGVRRITILHLLLAVLCLAGGWGLGKLAAAVIERRIFPRTTFDMGIRTAIVTSVSYVLLIAGALAAVHALGFDLTNLAIMAGALGVGIGFGLQTLVSNFVSGLVILFERPFRIGDILEHDGVYGYVRTIRKRSTVLRTFDESELVLPNAELLSHKITNWTLSDNRARGAVTVGVAYGSDVVKVRDTLLRLAREHPRVVDEPLVYFTAFGDSALEFRLLFWADIRERLAVMSDLHFAIDAAFRELGIQIPFPQRDVHVYAAGGPAAD